MKTSEITFLQSLAFILSYYKKTPIAFVFVVFSRLSQSGTELVGPFALSLLVDYLNDSHNGIIEFSWNEAAVYLSLILGAGVSFWILHRITHHYYDKYLIIPAMREIGNNAFSQVQKFSTDWHINNFSGAVVRKISRGVWAAEQFSGIFYDRLFPPLFIALGIIIFAFFKSSSLGFFVAIMTIVYMAVSISLNMKYIAPASKKSVQEDSKVGAVLADSITSNASVRSFANEEKEEKIVFQQNAIWAESVRIKWKMHNVIGFILAMFMTMMKAGMYILPVFLFSRNLLTLGEVVFMISLYNLLAGYLRSIGENIRELQQAKNNLEDVIEFIHREPEIQDAKNAKTLQVSHGEIIFNKISFQYEKQKNEIFKDFSLQVPAGQKIALVGKSGSGKSSFIKLLQRLYDVKKGEIYIDGQDISKITQKSLRKNIALVPQDPALFHRSLAENIAYGKRKATQKEIEKASQAAYAHEFIIDLPDGYKTLVGERGVKLSGGERQRVAIARAVIVDAPILILDEATSSLDSESEQLIQKALHNVMEGRTSFVIAHRLSTIKEVDRILVFDKGKIIEDGSFDELIQKDKVFAKLWKLQKLD